MAELHEIKRSINANYSQTGVQKEDEELVQARARVKELEEDCIRLKLQVDRLKDEAETSELRHKGSLDQINQKFDEELQRKENFHNDMMKRINAQHAEAVDSLKKIHLDEISKIKERANEGRSLEQLMEQIRSTMGSMRLIEEQLAQRQHGLELVKDGQMEARERLLSDLESKTRERAEFAEAEGMSPLPKVH